MGYKSDKEEFGDRLLRWSIEIEFVPGSIKQEDRVFGYLQAAMHKMMGQVLSEHSGNHFGYKLSKGKK